MKKIIALLLLLPLFTMAQEKSAPASVPKNILRWNLSSLALGNYHFTYERAISRKISLSLSYRFMPTGTIPYKDYFDDNLQRLGMGQGFYDNTIEDLKVKNPNLNSFGIAFDFQRSEQTLPTLKTDLSLDFVVTNQNIFTSK